MTGITVTDAMLDSLRERVKPYMNGKEYRYAHTLGVERECKALGELLLPEKINKLRASALLHDITKVLGAEEQLKLCDDLGIKYGKRDLMSPKLFHARTASELIKRDFPEFADDEIISAVRYHTTGRRGMTLFEGIVYLADYIEETRTFEECKELRRCFWGAVEKGEKPVMSIYYDTMIKSFDFSIEGLLSDGSPIDPDTVDARNYFLELVRGDVQ